MLDFDSQRASSERQGMSQPLYWLDRVGRAAVPPEKVMNEFKSYASRELNRLDRDGADRKGWARRGSTRWLWKDEDLQQALQYVVEEQGEPMALFIAEML
jgi:hypothetical protein